MISTNPYKGTKDFYPLEQLVQNYIFSKWKKVALSHSFEEYQTPIIEPAEIYEAKSGEDVGNKELFTFYDLAERKLSLRPEMTPSVTRIVAAKYKELPKPIKYFSIGSFYRNERPQKGRNREFWQINADIFGDNTIFSDIEVVILSLNIMKEFKAPKNSFTIYINNRKLLNSFYSFLELDTQAITKVTRIIDKYQKLSLPAFHIELEKLLSKEKVIQIEKFLGLNLIEISKVFPTLIDSEGFAELNKLTKLLEELGYKENISFKPSLVRGFDYYDGLVFEVFDNNPENNRSLFGGGRYNGLAKIFGQNNFPAVGFAVGNETFRIFLENWNLIPDIKHLKGKKQIAIFSLKTQDNTNLQDETMKQIFHVSNKIRNECQNIELETILEPKSLSSGLEYLSNKESDFAMFIGEDEYNSKTITIKQMDTGSQKTLSLDSLITFLKQLPHEIN
jgi:histidyl-tRNA synthetase